MVLKPNPSVLRNEMLGMNYKIWTQMGFLCPQDKRRYIFVVPGLLFAFSLLGYLALSGASLLMLTIDFFFFVLHVVGLVSGWNLKLFNVLRYYCLLFTAPWIAARVFVRDEDTYTHVTAQTI